MGFLGRASWEKGLEVLGEAAQSAGMTVAVGAPVTPLLTGIVERFPDVFRVEGKVVGAEFLSRIEVLVVPSIWEEPLGRIVLEAAAAGASVIISDTPGLIEAAVVSGARWATFRRGNPDDLASVLRSVSDGTIAWQQPSTHVPLGDVDDLIAIAHGPSRR